MRIDLTQLVFAFALGLTGAWVVARWGAQWGIIDKPNQRSSHRNSTPKGGGIGILAAFVLFAMLNAVPLFFWLPAAGLSLLSLYGDRRELSARLRLVAQIVACGIVVANVFPGDLISPGHLAAAILGLLFMVATTNFYNFMDGIDGIAGLSGIIAFGFLAFYLGREGGSNAFLHLSLVISASCLGFLPFNLPNARVFMGDGGSILLGFVFAGSILCFDGTLLDFLVMTSFLFPFYADELTTMVVRIRLGENLTQAHRRHLYQLLANEMGWRHWKVTLLYAALQFFLGASVLGAKKGGVGFVIFLLMVYGVLFVGVTFRVRKHLSTIRPGYES